MPGAPDCAYSSTAWPIRWDFQHQHQRSNAFNSLTPNFLPCFHCQNVKDHSPCLPHFLILNAKSKSGSRTDGICPRDRHVKFENNTSGRARLWDTALKFLCPGLFITSPDHLAWSTVLIFFSFFCLCGYHELASRLHWSVKVKVY